MAVEGNAVLVCAGCGSQTDKGCPPIPGQGDAGYRCEPCQVKIDAAAQAAKAPTIVISGGG